MNTLNELAYCQLVVGLSGSTFDLIRFPRLVTRLLPLYLAVSETVLA